MFVHPLVNAKTTITNIDEECVQPNAVDIRISKLYRLRDPMDSLLDETFHRQPDGFILGKTTKKHLDVEEMEPRGIDVDDEFLYGWELPAGGYFQFETQHNVEVAEGEMGWLIARSTLTRNGMFVTSGLYDSGFRGNLAGAIHLPHVRDGGFRRYFIEQGARVAQFLLTKADTYNMYNGDYNDTGVIR